MSDSFNHQKTCDCDICAINKEIEQQFNYCETFHYYRNMHYLNKNEYNKIFTTKLTKYNVIEYGSFFFFMIKIEKSDDGSDYIDTSDEDTDIQIDKQITRHSNTLCKRTTGIANSYIINSLKNAEYKFVMSSKIDLSNNKSCPILAFRLLKNFDYLSIEEPLFSFLKNFKIIESLLICAIELTREDKSSIISKKLILKASLGALITYKSVQFAINEKFDYYFSRAASVSLIYVYKKWGFNLGIPFLNLNFILNKHQELLSVGKEEQKEITLNNIIHNEIKMIFQKNYRVCKAILGINKGEWENAISLGSD